MSMTNISKNAIIIYGELSPLIRVCQKTGKMRIFQLKICAFALREER